MVIQSINAIDAAMDKLSFLNVPPPKRPRLAASMSTYCVGARRKTVARPNAR